MGMTPRPGWQDGPQVFKQGEATGPQVRFVPAETPAVPRCWACNEPINHGDAVALIDQKHACHFGCAAALTGQST